MTNTVIFLVIAAAVAAAILIPLLRRGPAGGQSSRPGQRPATRTRELSADLAEIELDRAMGRLSESDHADLRARYEAADAASPVTVLAPAPPSTGDEALSPAADAPVTDLDARAEAMIRTYRESGRPPCPSCGPRPEASARFCSSCGRFLVSCPGCGRAVQEPGSRFCAGCGASLAA